MSKNMVERVDAKALLAGLFPTEDTHRWNAEICDGKLRYCTGYHSGECRDDDWQEIDIPAALKP